MKPENPIVKYSVRMIYLFLFWGITFVITVAFSFLIAIFYNYGIDLKKIGKILPIIIGLMLFAYSFWLAKESSIAFSENNCFFVEAIFISIKKSLMYLPFLPIIGKYFDKQQNDGIGQYRAKNMDE